MELRAGDRLGLSTGDDLRWRRGPPLEAAGSWDADRLLSERHANPDLWGRLQWRVAASSSNRRRPIERGVIDGDRCVFKVQSGSDDQRYIPTMVVNVG